MESLTKEVRWRKPALKPLKIVKSRSEGADGLEKDVFIVSGEEEPMSPYAQMFHEPSFNFHILCVMGTKTPIDPCIFYENLPKTLLKHPRFSSVPVMDEKNGGKLKWVPTNVNLDSHIVIPEIPSNLGCPDKFVEEYLHNLSKETTIDPYKPLWKLHILNLKTSNAEGVCILQIHHSLGDGTSLMSLLLACTRQTSNPEALPTIPVGKSSPWWLLYGKGSSQRWIWFYLVAIWRVIQLFRNTLVDIMTVMLTTFFLKDTETPIIASLGAELAPRRFVFRIISLDDMKLIKNAMNLTLNDVALGFTQAGLSRYLNRRYGWGMKDHAESEKKNSLPDNILLRSTLLINMRPSSGIQVLADMMKEDTEARWGNWVGYMLLPFTIGLRDDPLDYVREAKATVDRKKNSIGAMCTFTITQLVFKLFGIKVASNLLQRTLGHTTVTFSNVVGPVEEISFFGIALENIAFSFYGPPQGLIISLLSYVDKMAIAVSVDESTVPNPDQLCDDLEQALQLMKAAVLAKGIVEDEDKW